MGLTKQLALTMAFLFGIVFVVSALAVLWQDTYLHLTDQARALVAAAANRFDPADLRPGH